MNDEIVTAESHATYREVMRAEVAALRDQLVEVERERGACWDDARIATSLAGRPFVTLRQVADDASLDLDDRLWVLCHALHALDDRACRLYAIESAMRTTQHAGDEGDRDLHAAILRELIEIEDRPESERAAAWAAAWATARGAAWDADIAAARHAWDAAWDAAWATARSAAWAAAMDAARDAAWAAAWAAARDAAWDAAARNAELDNAIARALEWLGDWADEEVMP